MAVEQMNISISPQMARFIRRKVRSGGYTNTSEVVRTAVRRMQEEEAREARLASAAAGEILDALTTAEKAAIRDRVRDASRRLNVASIPTMRAAPAWRNWRQESNRAGGGPLLT